MGNERSEVKRERGEVMQNVNLNQEVRCMMLRGNVWVDGGQSGRKMWVWYI